MKILEMVIDYIISIFRGMRKTPSHVQHQSCVAGSQNIQAQAGGNVNITLAASSSVGGMQEANERSDEVLASMPQLMALMRSNLLAPEAKFVREFFVLPNRKCCIGFVRKPRFIYYENEHQNLRGQIDVLEAHGFVTDVTPLGNNTPIYRMTEKLVSHLCNGAHLDK